jgi:hypothetical protein
VIRAWLLRRRCIRVLSLSTRGTQLFLSVQWQLGHCGDLRGDAISEGVGAWDLDATFGSSPRIAFSAHASLDNPSFISEETYYPTFLTDSFHRVGFGTFSAEDRLGRNAPLGRRPSTLREHCSNLSTFFVLFGVSEGPGRFAGLTEGHGRKFEIRNYCSSTVEPVAARAHRHGRILIRWRLLTRHPVTPGQSGPTLCLALVGLARHGDIPSFAARTSPKSRYSL